MMARDGRVWQSHEKSNLSDGYYMTQRRAGLVKKATPPKTQRPIFSDNVRFKRAEESRIV